MILKQMELLEFLKLKPALNSQVNKIAGLKIVQKSNSIAIAIDQNLQIETVRILLQILRENKVAFALYDSFYPSASDPGAYFDYSPEQNVDNSTWSMTLGNHGWTGGVYSIEENVIANQIHNLIKHKQIDSIRIDDVKIFSHYGKKIAELNVKQNELISGIHPTARA